MFEDSRSDAVESLKDSGSDFAVRVGEVEDDIGEEGDMREKNRQLAELFCFLSEIFGSYKSRKRVSDIGANRENVRIGLQGLTIPLKVDSLKPSSRSQNHLVSSNHTEVLLRIAEIASDALTSVAILKRATIDP